MVINITWQHIPAGSVTLAPGGYLAETAVFNVPAFSMSQYPITNAQFTRFVEAGGYTNPEWWTAVGLRAKEKGGWTEPRYWHGRDWNQPDHPVVGVSWHEAVAFCNWLSRAGGETVVLPTEQQWQRAAQGDDGRPYPWGAAEPKPQLCNWNRAIDETSPVDGYPAGSGPFGVLDMSGNVWEWCRTGWESGTAVVESDESRILRGGCWSSDSPLSLQADNRRPHDPNTRLPPQERNLVTVGFRCAKSF